MNLLTDPALRDAAAWALVHSLWQFAIIALLAAGAMACARDSARLRYLIAGAALALMPLLLVASCAFVYRGAPPAPAAGLSIATTPAAAAESTAAPPAAHAVAPAHSWQAQVGDHAALITSLYLAGFAVFLLRLGIGSRQLLRLRRSASPVDAALQRAGMRIADTLNLRRRVPIMLSPCVDSPAVIGVLRPIVLVPACALTGMSIDQLHALLAHELAHLRRHDHLANFAQNIIEAMLFYHPATWWLSACVRREREHCCDDIALGLTGSPAVYARALAAMESLRTLPTMLALGAAGDRLLPRIRRVLRPRPAPALATRALLLVSLAVGLILAAGAVYTGCAPAEKPAAIDATPDERPRIVIDAQVIFLSAPQFSKLGLNFMIIDHYGLTDLRAKVQADRSMKMLAIAPVTIPNGDTAILQSDAAAITNLPPADAAMLSKSSLRIQAFLSKDHRYVIINPPPAQPPKSGVNTYCSVPLGGTLIIAHRDDAHARYMLLLLHPSIVPPRSATSPATP